MYSQLTQAISAEEKQSLLQRGKYRRASRLWELG